MRRALLVGTLLCAACTGQKNASKEDVLEMRALFAEDQIAQRDLGVAQQAANKKREELMGKINEIFARTGRDKSKWNIDIRTGVFTPTTPAPAPTKAEVKK